METPQDERHAEVGLSLPNGNLNPEARGWGRRPYWIDNLSGRFPRKKRWDYWCFVGTEKLYSVCIANVDYLGLIGVYILDYASGCLAECGTIRPLSSQPRMTTRTHGNTRVQFGKLIAEQRLDAAGGELKFSAPKCGGRPIEAEFHYEYPAHFETLNVLVPWSDRNYQFTSKQVPLPAWGSVKWGDETWTFDRESTFGVRDYGRGIWPYRTDWNWAALSGKDKGRTYGINLGGQWTDGTNATENGLILEGKLHKIHQDTKFEYDRKDFIKPWRLHTPGSNAVDLELVPFYDKHSRANLGIMSTNVHQCFGRFTGRVCADDESVDVDGALGWAEEQQARW